MSVIEFEDSRGGDIVPVTDIDFAAVLVYMGFKQMPPETTQQKKKKSKKNRNLTEFRFLAEHPEREFTIQKVYVDYINDDLKCSPRRLLSESRALRNLTHHKSLRI